MKKLAIFNILGPLLLSRSKSKSSCLKSDEIRKLKEAATRGILYKFCKIHRQTPVPESFLNKRLCPYTRICVPEKNPFFECFTQWIQKSETRIWQTTDKTFILKFSCFALRIFEKVFNRFWKGININSQDIRQ